MIKEDYFYDNQILEEIDEKGQHTFSLIGKQNVVQIRINHQDKVFTKDIEKGLSILRIKGQNILDQGVTMA